MKMVLESFLEVSITFGSCRSAITDKISSWKTGFSCSCYLQ